MNFLSIREATGNGDFILIATPPYLSKEHISVWLDGVKVESTGYEWINETTIRILATMGTRVRVIRRTSQDTLLTDYMDGVGLPADTLDVDSKQSFFMAQEAIDISAIMGITQSADYVEGTTAEDILNLIGDRISESNLDTNLKTLVKKLSDPITVEGSVAWQIGQEALLRAQAIANEASTRSSAILNEASARATALTAEASARSSAILNEATTRANAIAAETSARIAGIQANANAIAAEVTARANAIATKGAELLALEGRVDAKIATEATSRATADSAFTSQLTAMGSRVGTAEAQITTLNQTVTNNQSSLATQLTDLRTDFETSTSSLSSRITTEQTARTSADAALASRVSNLEAGYVGETDIQASITTESLARASADAALATQITDMKATIEAPTSSLSSRITTEQTARTTADSALASSISSLDAAYKSADSILTSRIATEETARASADYAIAQQVTLLKASGGYLFNETWTESDSLNGWSKISGVGEVTIVSNPTGIGGKAARFGNNSGNDTVWYASNKLIPFDSSKVYKTSARIKKVSGGATQFRIGFLGVAADRTTLVNFNGDNTHGSSYYHIANGNTPTEWTSYTGYSKGYGATVGTMSVASSLGTPGVMHPNVRYLRPLLVVNYDGIAGETEVDSFLVEDYSVGAMVVEETTARISGDSANASSITTLSSTVTSQGTTLAGHGTRLTTAEANITNEASTRASADVALSSQISAMNSAYKAADSTLTSRIATEETTRANAISALSSTVTTLTSTVNTNKSNIEASLATEQTTRATADSALSSSVTALTSTVNTNKANIEASLLAEQTTRATEDEALASDIKLLKTGGGYIFFDSFEDSSSLSKWVTLNGTGEMNIVSETHAVGGKVLQVGNNVGNDYRAIEHKDLIPFDPDKLYKLSVRLRKGGTGTVYVGYAGYAADGVTRVQWDGSPSGAYYYHCILNSAVTANHTTYVGYSKGRGATAGSTGSSPTITSPGFFHPNVRYIKPLMLLNYGNTEGITEIDFISIEDATVQASVVEEITARTTADTALASSITALTSTVNTNKSNIEASLATEQTTRANADSALSSSITALTSTVNTNKSNIEASLVTEQTTRANADSALSSSLTALTSTVNTNKGNIEASLVTEQTTRASEDSALATEIKFLKAGLGSMFYDSFEDSSLISNWKVMGGTGELSIATASNAVGGKVLRVGNNSGNDLAFLGYKDLMPFDSTKLYRITTRVRRLNGTGTIYLGLLGYAADGTTLVNPDGTTSGTRYYHCASGASPSDSNWVTYVGYTKGCGSIAGNSIVGTITSPSKMHPNVRYFAPMIYVNFSTAGITEVDFMMIEDASLDASVAEEITARTNGDSALSSQITTLSASVTGHETRLGTVETSASTSATKLGVVVANYTIKTQARSDSKLAFAGIGLNSTVTGTISQSDIVFMADKLSFVPSTAINSTLTPLFTSGLVNGVSTFTINATTIGDQTIGARMVVDGSIEAKHVKANSITADKIDSRGLSIKDASGTVLFASGTALDQSLIENVSSLQNANVSGVNLLSTTVGLQTVGAGLYGRTLENIKISTAINELRINPGDVLTLSADLWCDASTISAGQFCRLFIFSKASSTAWKLSAYIEGNSVTSTRKSVTITLPATETDSYTVGIGLYHHNAASDAAAVGNVYADRIKVERGAVATQYVPGAEPGATKGATWGTDIVGAPYETIYNNDDSSALGFNPSLYWPSGTAPSGWSYFGTSSAVTKETTLVRLGSNAVRFTSDGVLQAGIQKSVVWSAPLPSGTFLMGTFDAQYVSRTSGYAGIIVDLWRNSAGTVYDRTIVLIPQTTVGVWQRVPFTARITTAGAQIYGVRIFMLGAWSGFVNGTANATTVFDNLRFMFADNTTDNKSITLSESAGTITITGSGGGSVTAVTSNNPVTSSNASTFIANAALGNAHIGGDLWSTNYVANTSGWIIKRDGSAEFSNVKVRGDVQATSLNGSNIVSGGNILAGSVSDVETTELGSDNVVPANYGAEYTLASLVIDSGGRKLLTFVRGTVVMGAGAAGVSRDIAIRLYLGGTKVREKLVTSTSSITTIDIDFLDVSTVAAGNTTVALKAICTSNTTISSFTGKAGLSIVSLALRK